MEHFHAAFTFSHVTAKDSSLEGASRVSVKLLTYQLLTLNTK